MTDNERIPVADDMVTSWETAEAENVRRQERTLELAEKQIAMQERYFGQDPFRQEIVGDSALDRMTAYWRMTPEQQDFRLREEAVGHACKLGGTITEVLHNADTIFAYILGEKPHHLPG